MQIYPDWLYLDLSQLGLSLAQLSPCLFYWFEELFGFYGEFRYIFLIFSEKKKVSVSGCLKIQFNESSCQIQLWLNLWLVMERVFIGYLRVLNKSWILPNYFVSGWKKWEVISNQNSSQKRLLTSSFGKEKITSSPYEPKQDKCLFSLSFAQRFLCIGERLL